MFVYAPLCEVGDMPIKSIGNRIQQYECKSICCIALFGSASACALNPRVPMCRVYRCIGMAVQALECISVSLYEQKVHGCGCASATVRMCVHVLVHR